MTGEAWQCLTGFIAGIGVAAAVDIDLMVEAGDWPCEDALSAVAAAVAAASPKPRPSADGVELSILFTDDAHIQSLNAEWRDKDKPTNVLSFPAFRAEQAGPLPPMLGDIVLAAETVTREAVAGRQDRSITISAISSSMVCCI